MAAQSPIKDPIGASTETLTQQPDSSSSIIPTVKSEIPVAASASPSVGIVPRASEPETINIPSYSRWFSWNNVHECEVRFLPEFFDARSPSKNPRVYKYYRNSIILSFRQNPSRKLTFTDVRKILVGDPLKWEEKDNKSGGASSHTGDAGGGAVESIPKRRWCSGCKSLCSIACFACDKFDLTLCARCYVRGNYRVGVNSSDFRRVEISEDTKAGWTDKETLHLLEAVLHYGDDWKKVAEHVGGRNEKECVTHFIKLSFGEQYLGHTSSGDVDNKFSQAKDQSDAGFGQENIGTSSAKVAEAAARAAVASLSDVDPRKMKEGLGSFANGARIQDPNVESNGNTTSNVLEGAYVDAKSLLEREELDVERAISGITEVQMKEIRDKIVHFEEFELHMEKEWQQLQQMKNLLFVDQLTLLFQKAAAPKTGELMGGENVRTD
ncbi:SWI/SNF complex subunit SWI3B [Vitis vinifera]|uniref:SWI/SNF complex subunit SWI3B n=1 Tax=Vitis vinifera TaxID=29760 RepID=A0A438ET46_VITVI|nr:SWI/SNF complex subunit SWI3B [Vitis vinifera]